MPRNFPSPSMNQFLLRLRQVLPTAHRAEFLPACAKRFISVNTADTSAWSTDQSRLHPATCVLSGITRFKIEIYGVAKSLAARARPVRIVKRKQPRLRLFISHVAVLAFEALGKPQLLVPACSHLVSRGKSKITSPASRYAVSTASTMRARASGRNRHAIHQHVHRLVEIEYPAATPA